MLYLPHFRDLVLRPSLKGIDMWTPAAENLLLLTALVESELSYLKQVPQGPALGLFQMERRTFNDVLEYLEKRRFIADKIVIACNLDSLIRTDKCFIGNLAYQCMIARVFYWRFEERLPYPDDIEGLANYHKKYYNTKLGKADPKKSIEIYKRYVRAE